MALEPWVGEILVGMVRRIGLEYQAIHAVVLIFRGVAVGIRSGEHVSDAVVGHAGHVAQGIGDLIAIAERIVVIGS